MERKLFKEEVKRLLLNKKILVILAFSALLLVLQANTGNNYEGTEGADSAFLRIIGFDPYGVGTNLYIMVFPFIAAIVGSSLFAEDKRSNFYLYPVMRVTPKKYIRISALASFVAGAVAVNIPFLLQSWFCFMRYPTTGLDIFNEWMPVGVQYWGYSLFLKSPLLLWGVYILIYFLFGGIYALMGHCVSYFSRTKYLETIFPFLIQIALWLFFSLINLVEYSPMIILSPYHSSNFAGQGYYNGISMILYIVLLPVILAAIVWRRSHNELL